MPPTPPTRTTACLLVLATALRPAYAHSAWGRYNRLFAAADGDPRYLAGKLATQDGTAYVALMVGKQRTQPVATNATDAGKAKNRRVELVAR